MLPSRSKPKVMVGLRRGWREASRSKPKVTVGLLPRVWCDATLFRWEVSLAWEQHCRCLEVIRSPTSAS